MPAVVQAGQLLQTTHRSIEQKRRRTSLRSPGLQEDLLHDTRRLEACKPFFQSVSYERQLLVMQPELMQNRGMEIMNTHGIFHDGMSEFIGLPVRRTTTNAASRHP